MSKAVSTTRDDVTKALPVWERVRACLGGEDAVKALGDKVLPRPNPSDTSEANKLRYESYKTRAVFVNATGRTSQGLVGYVFSKDPVVTLPAALESLEHDIDGAGTTLHQLAKRTLAAVVGLGHCGLLTDYPKSEGSATTAAQLKAGDVRPTVTFYEPEQIINWRVAATGAKTALVFLVLRETTLEEKDEFTSEAKTQYRVLTLNGNAVQVRIFDADGEVVETFDPKDAKGNPLTEIPFTFVGSETNDATIDPSPLGDLATLNLAHYRNSADYEEAVYMVGQPTPWFSGLTEEWVANVLKGQVLLGSRAAVLLPPNGAAGMLQVSPNTMPKEAMESKERLMVALGAKLVEQKQVQRTATEASMEQASETSILTTCANNVFAAFTRALKFAGVFVGDTTSEVSYDLSEPLVLADFAPDKANAILALIQGGLIDFEEARFNLKKSGIAWKDDNEVKDNVLADGFGTPPANPNANPDPNAQPPA